MQAHIHKKQQEETSVAAPIPLACSEPKHHPEAEPSEDALEDEHVPDQDVPDPTAENNASADINRALKRKLKEAVTVANGCYRALERERMQRVKGVEENGRLRFHLQLSREAFLKIKNNPRGMPVGVTPEQVKALVEEKERKAREDEHWRQECIETALKRELEIRQRIQQEKEQRERKRLQSMPRYGPKTKRETEEDIKLIRAAQAIARSHGRDHLTVGDFREAVGNPRRCGDRRVK
jgi:hypothetical protein